MKTLLICLTSLFLFSNVQSQDLPEKQRVCFGVGISIGFFNPQDVNDYITRTIPDYKPVFGFKELISNYALNTTLGWKIYQHWEFQWLVEGAMAPKYAMVNDESYFYDFWRISSGVMVNFHIPTNPIGKNSIYLGAGPIFHYMTFKSFSGVAVGGRFQVGYSINNYKFNPQIYLAADYANAEDHGFNLNYSSVKIGCNVNF